MIQVFKEDAPGILNRVEAAIQASDAEQLRIAAHALRGLVSAFSASLNETAQILEQMGIDRHAAEADEQYQLISRGVRDLGKSLTTLTIEQLRGLP
jgi:HPt (histidine-containing phosphotransfer) domain-containing protein